MTTMTYRTNGYNSSLGKNVALGVGSYFKGKAQVQIAKKNPQLYMKLRKTENLIYLISIISFVLIFIGIIGVIVFLISFSKPISDEEKKNNQPNK
jgi:hypothetical protein